MSDTTTKTAILVSIAGVIGTLLGATVAPLVTYLTNERQMDVKMVEIGIGILREPPKEGTAVMREWAIDLIEVSARKSFTPTQRQVLLNKPLLVSFEDLTQRLNKTDKMLDAWQTILSERNSRLDRLENRLDRVNGAVGKPE